VHFLGLDAFDLVPSKDQSHDLDQGPFGLKRCAYLRIHTADAADAHMDQDEIIEFLSDGEAYGQPGAAVERIETHAAIVFLVGERAFKLKRAVEYSFLDFSTPDMRHAVLEAELRLNRRTAPDLYRRVLPVARAHDGGLALDGDGQPVDWLLEMTRFEQRALLDNVAMRHGLDDRLLEQLAEAIVDFHGKAEVRRDHGGHRGLLAVIEGNARDLRSLADDVVARERVDALNERTAALLERHARLLEARREEGRVRHCHGDLHLGNLLLLDDRPVLFDCLEFDEALACTDVLYDLAFLLMDLLHRGLRAEAQTLLGDYLELDPDDAGTALLPLFMSVRAAIRAKVDGFKAQLGDDADERERAVEVASAYLDLALDLLDPRPARLIAVGGLSGTGKSTIARALAPDIGAAPGAVLLRSDRLRKRLFGADPTTRLGPDAYEKDVTRRVYDRIAARAEALLRAGHSVIADAVYARPEQRAQIEQAAKAAGAPFSGVWLDAPAEVLAERIEGRTGDASDATTEILRRQLEFDLGELTWSKVDARGPGESVLERARAVLGLEP
jgi:aminoglycoside phosphotransferase family enzyme/predicted kinase